MAIASAKIKARIIEISILGAAKGFLLKALTLEEPTSAITTDGPNVLIIIIKNKVRFFIWLIG